MAFNVVVEEIVVTAALYGPTNGPPPPTGGAPAGWMKSVPVSASARAMLMRPLPVWIWVPAGSALRAGRPALTPFTRGRTTALLDPAVDAAIDQDDPRPLSGG